MTKLSFEHRVVFAALAAGLPAVLVTLLLLWHGDYAMKTRWTLALFVVVLWLGFAFGLRNRIRFPLQTISNILQGLREGDFSLRARGARRDDALGDMILELNQLVATLREQRLGAVEAVVLLQKVMSEIDVAIFAFDGKQNLCLVNRAGERLLSQASEPLVGRSALALGLAECLEGESARIVEMAFPGGLGRWGLRRSSFRERGIPHQLLVLTDLSRTLREEERQAWQRLIRVLGHELHNSLAPIKSIAGSLEGLLLRDPPPADWKEDMRRGFEVIQTRAEALARFTEDYSRLARLPPPRKQSVEIRPLLQRVIKLETRLPVELRAGPEIQYQADADQLEQLVINLVRNAVDAVFETGGTVTLSARKTGTHFELLVEDQGQGISNSANLFVPFFTTKPNGTGIGLVLCRQIAEAHGGTLTLENRAGGPGCEALLRLPLK